MRIGETMRSETSSMVEGGVVLSVWVAGKMRSDGDLESRPGQLEQSYIWNWLTAGGGTIAAFV